MGFSIAILACAKVALDDRAFKASLPDAAHGIALAIEHKDAEEFVVWTAPEDRQQFGLNTDKAKRLLDWYHATGATTAGLITYNGRTSAPRSYLEGATAEIHPATGEEVTLFFHDGPRGYRCRSVSTLLVQGLSALTQSEGAKSSDACRKAAALVHQEAPRLREMGFSGVTNGTRFDTWDEYEKGLIKAADYQAQRGL